LDLNPGDILFGAVDLSRFESPLLTLPMKLDDEGDYWGYSVTMAAFHYRHPFNGKTDFASGKGPWSVVLDSGWTTITIPSDLAREVAEAFYSSVSSNGMVYTPCFHRHIKRLAGLYFDFQEIEIYIDWSDLVDPPEEHGDRNCSTRLHTKEGITSIMLGVPFLRQTYVVHDLVGTPVRLLANLCKDLHEISLAPAVTDWKPENVVFVEKNHSSIPGAIRSNISDPNHPSISREEIKYIKGIVSTKGVKA
jgi:hypothetical protein